ncbi:MAG: hypothetical protein QXW18_06015 [Candidatus Bathyarchaeia archaeon]
MSGFLSMTDAMTALCFSVVVILAVCVHTYSNNDYLLAAQTSYLQKVAQQILLVSAMKGYFTELINKVELGQEITPILVKIGDLCPPELTCRLYILYNGKLLTFFGYLADPVFGEAKYFVTTSRGMLEVICQVSAK